MENIESAIIKRYRTNYNPYGANKDINLTSDIENFNRNGFIVVDIKIVNDEREVIVCFILKRKSHF
ncbi:MAG TPA: hypothetical protein PLS10_03710 [Chitinophagales bacterium]|nr:hypothetical protein [Chitinophagales bacterium]